MRILFLALAAALPPAIHAQAPRQPQPLGNEVGFFKPAADPALTALRAAPRAPQPGALAGGEDEMTRAIRAAEEARLERAAREHEAAHAAGSEISQRPPAVGSPLDGTAQIMSPLDGSAPILSPLGR